MPQVRSSVAKLVVGAVSAAFLTTDGSLTDAADRYISQAARGVAAVRGRCSSPESFNRSESSIAAPVLVAAKRASTRKGLLLATDAD